MLAWHDREPHANTPEIDNGLDCRRAGGGKVTTWEVQDGGSLELRGRRTAGRLAALPPLTCCPVGFSRVPVMFSSSTEGNSTSANLSRGLNPVRRTTYRNTNYKLCLLEISLFVEIHSAHCLALCLEKIIVKYNFILSIFFPTINLISQKETTYTIKSRITVSLHIL